MPLPGAPTWSEPRPIGVVSPLTPMARAARPKLKPDQTDEVRKMVLSGRKSAADAARLFGGAPFDDLEALANDRLRTTLASKVARHDAIFSSMSIRSSNFSSNEPYGLTWPWKNGVSPRMLASVIRLDHGVSLSTRWSINLLM